MYFKIGVTLILIVFVRSTPTDLGIGNIFDEDIISDADFPNDLHLNEEIEDPKPLSVPLVKAVAVLKGFSTTLGLIHLVQYGSGPTQITGKIIGLRPVGSHGFHVHEKPVIGSCESAGEHYNPTRRHHGGPNSLRAHVGDLGNVHANIKGISTINLIDHKISLIGRHSIIGRSLVVHINKDDLGNGPNYESKRTGNSGGRLACGTIKFVHLKKH